MTTNLSGKPENGHKVTTFWNQKKFYIHPFYKYPKNYIAYKHWMLSI